MTILLTGATGTVGRAVARQLLEAGEPVRALTRDPARAAPLLPEVELVAGDLGDPDSLPSTLDGVDRVFLLSVGPRKAEHDAHLAQAAAKAGVARLVALSSLAAEEDPDGLLGRWHADGERAVRDAGPAWTIVRPGGFMSNALEWAPSVREAGVVRAPFGDLRASIVDPRDIAAVVVAALNGGHDGAVLPLSGPAAISPAEQVEVLAGVLGRPLRFEELDVAQARAAMARRVPAEVVDAVLAARAAAGPFRARVLPTVEDVTGRVPRSFRQWAEDHADTFR
ncbi:SDR family oxidoreductase [Dactylosporangium sp. NPDC000521]|uniref:SDR family oxidoreductase n=1 Tax=Dactylosporangium sp. NPDC000521 TaxID=3363975 RepID=UPI0036974D12